MNEMFKRPLVLITLIYISIILVSTWINDNYFKKNFKETRKNIDITGIVNSEPSTTDKGIAFILRAENGVKLRVFVDQKDLGVEYGDRVRLKGLFSTGKHASNPDEFDYQEHLERQGIAGCLFARENIEIMENGKGNPFISGARRLKKRIRSIFEETLPGDYSKLLGSIIFGIKASPISEETKDKYRRTGVVHILVASGQQVSILAGLCIAFGRFSNMPFFVVALVSSCFVWGFAAMAGFGSSIIRAAIMGQVMITSLLLDRENDFYSSFSLAALILLLIDPGNLFDIGFQLSFLATWALVYIAPILSAQFEKKLPVFLSQALSISIAPVMVTAPIGIFYFSQLSLVSIAANMFVVPMAEILTTLGFISSILGLVFLPAAHILNSFLLILMILLENMVRMFSSIPDSFVYVAKPGILAVLGYYLFILYLVEQVKDLKINMQRLKKSAFVVVPVLLIFLTFQAIAGPKDLEMTFMDVGQGDSIYLDVPGGGNMLIDAGEEKAGKMAVVPFLQRKGVNKIDIVVITHAHDDHIGGLVPVLETFKVSDVLDSGFPFMTKTYEDILHLVKEKNIRYHIAKEGQSFRFGKADVAVLGPPAQFIEGTLSDPNNNSIILKIDYGKRSFLLTGDAAFEEEEKIIGSGADVKSDVIKAGHHGSSTSTSDGLLNAVDPGTAVISVGEYNKFGHPSRRVAMSLMDKGIRTFRTDKNGAVIFKCDGSRIDVMTAR